MIVPGLPVSAKFLLLDALVRDQCWIALFTADANLSPRTPDVPPYGEVVGPGYVRGGLELHGGRVQRHGDRVGLTWDDPIWPVATITARAAVIYNSTRKDAAVAILDFGEDQRSTNGPFRVRLPEAVLEIP